MENATIPLEENTDALPSPADYRSTLLQAYVEHLKQDQAAELLDLGPVCEENIMFFARQVKRHCACDMFIRLDRTLRKQLPLKQLWNHLDYARQRFRGILLWDFIDHLDDNQVGDFLESCHRMLQPNAMMMANTFEERSAPDFVYSYVIQDDYRIIFRQQQHLDLPRHYRSNRELISLLATFRLVKSFIYRNGVREFLFQRI
ncbi:MAG: hypothetical protein PVF56_00605 [Desulfobacterales bacterium]